MLRFVRPDNWVLWFIVGCVLIFALIVLTVSLDDSQTSTKPPSTTERWHPYDEFSESSIRDTCRLWLHYESATPFEQYKESLRGSQRSSLTEEKRERILYSDADFYAASAIWGKFERDAAKIRSHCKEMIRGIPTPLPK